MVRCESKQVVCFFIFSIIKRIMIYIIVITLINLFFSLQATKTALISNLNISGNGEHGLNTTNGNYLMK